MKRQITLNNTTLALFQLYPLVRVFFWRCKDYKI